MIRYHVLIRLLTVVFFISSDALSTALSALYAKIVVIIGIALPITEILSQRIPAEVYQGFYVYLYFVSISFVVFIYAAQLRNRAMISYAMKDFREYPILYMSNSKNCC
jgi:hypothetical protein